MFTGLVEEMGVVVSTRSLGDAVEFTMKGSIVMNDLDVDDSIAVNGCCLTVTSREKDTFMVTAVQETLKKTTLGSLKTGDRINLERALAVGDRLGGHFVQGHVDATGRINNVIVNDAGSEIWIEFPAPYRKWLIPVGSVCVNGISLTVADVTETSFKVAVIPHTLAVTTLAEAEAGDAVNLEFDMLVKYIENFTQRT